MNPTTSFRELREAGACVPRYRHLAKALGGIKAYGLDTPITSRQILESNGEDDVLWAWRKCPSLKPLSDDYWAKRKALYDDYLAKRKPLLDDYEAKLKPLVRQVIEEWEVAA